MARLLCNLVTFLFSFETFFILFLFAGRYKADPRFAWVSVDITALFFVLSVISGMIIFLRRRFVFNTAAGYISLSMVFFVIWSVASLGWTIGNVYAEQKALFIATLTLWPLLGTAFIIASDYRRIQRFMIGIVIFALWMALEGLLYYIGLDQSEFVSALGGNYLGVGRTIGLAALIVFIYWLFSQRNRYSRSFALGLFFLFISVLLVSGGRGPLLATVISLLVPGLLGWHMYRNQIFLKRYQSSFLCIELVLLIAVSYLLITGNLTTSLERFLLLFTETGGGDSASKRFEYFAMSFDFWLESPFVGSGIGSWPMLTNIDDVRAYPHNLILEVMVELGLIGLIFLLALFVVALRSIGFAYIHSDPVRMLVLMLFLNALFNALVSGDISDNRNLFAMVGLMAIGRSQGPKYV